MRKRTVGSARRDAWALEKAELDKFCATDAAELLGRALELSPPTGSWVPADYLDLIIEEVLDYRLVLKVLSNDMLGQCLFDSRIIEVNSQMSSFCREKTDIEGLRISTKTHEVGHIRRAHDRALRAQIDTMTPSLFGEALEPTVIKCMRGGLSASTGWGERVREIEADAYAAAFLVPQGRLREHPATQRLDAARDGRIDIPDNRLWPTVYELARHFRISASFMCTRLEALGYVTKNGKTLSLRRTPGVQLEMEGILA